MPFLKLNIRLKATSKGILSGGVDCLQLACDGVL
jgi:hypothetical protein